MLNIKILYSLGGCQNFIREPIFSWSPKLASQLLRCFSLDDIKDVSLTYLFGDGKPHLAGLTVYLDSELWDNFWRGSGNSTEWWGSDPVWLQGYLCNLSGSPKTFLLNVVTLKFFFFPSQSPLYPSPTFTRVLIAGYSVITIIILFKVALPGLFESYSLVSLLAWFSKSSRQRSLFSLLFTSRFVI